MKYETVGERICYCRNLIGLSQREFAVDFDISKPTITRWELDAVTIPPKKIAALLEFFNQRGLMVSAHWLMYGTGTEPINQFTKHIENLNFDEITYITFNKLKCEIKNFEFHQINTMFFEPVLSYADYVAGVIIDNSKINTLNNRLCFATTAKDVVVGVFDYNNLSLKNFFNESYTLNEKTFCIGEVLWSAKRF